MGKKRVSKQFPFKLYRMLEDAGDKGFDDVISWTSDGKAFQIFDKDKLAAILPLYMHSGRFKSFQRSLNIWGFSAIRFNKEKHCEESISWLSASKSASASASASASGANKTTNTITSASRRYHPFFLRGQPDLIAQKMTRTRVKVPGARYDDTTDNSVNEDRMKPTKLESTSIDTHTGSEKCTSSHKKLSVKGKVTSKSIATMDASRSTDKSLNCVHQEKDDITTFKANLIARQQQQHSLETFFKPPLAPIDRKETLQPALSLLAIAAGQRASTSQQYQQKQAAAAAAAASAERLQAICAPSFDAATPIPTGMLSAQINAPASLSTLSSIDSLVNPASKLSSSSNLQELQLWFLRQQQQKQQQLLQRLEQQELAIIQSRQQNAMISALQTTRVPPSPPLSSLLYTNHRHKSTHHA